MNSQEQQRQQFYNASLEKVSYHGERFAIFTIKPDKPIQLEHAGQFIQIGLGGWEKRLPGCMTEILDDKHREKVGKRLYSISSQPTFFDTKGQNLELFISLLRSVPAGKAPFLTPRLFRMQPGERLFCGTKAAGHYSLEPVKPSDDILFISTGTGIAPHNAMTAELLRRDHKGRIIVLESQFSPKDCPYEPHYRQLEKKIPNLQYINFINGNGPNKGLFLQDYILSGRFISDTKWQVDPNRTHAYVCGGPRVLSPPHLKDGLPVFDHRGGLIEVLHKTFSLTIENNKKLPHIHWESFWHEKDP